MKRRQSGFVWLGTAPFLVLFGLAVYLAIKIVPPYMASYEMQDNVDQQASIFVYNSADENAIRRKIFAECVELGLPVNQDQIFVEKAPDHVTIRVSWEIPVDIPIHPFTLHFTAKASQNRIA